MFWVNILGQKQIYRERRNCIYTYLYFVFVLIFIGNEFVLINNDRVQIICSWILNKTTKLRIYDIEFMNKAPKRE